MLKRKMGVKILLSVKWMWKKGDCHENYEHTEKENVNLLNHGENILNVCEIITFEQFSGYICQRACFPKWYQTINQNFSQKKLDTLST